MVGPGTYDSKNIKAHKGGSQNVIFNHATKKTFVVDQIERNKNPGPQYNVK